MKSMETQEKFIKNYIPGSEKIMNNHISVEAQDRFDKIYITGSEIEERLCVSRANILYARRRGMLPNALTVGNSGMYIWEREGLEPFLFAWNLSLQSSRGQL